MLASGSSRNDVVQVHLSSSSYPFSRDDVAVARRLSRLSAPWQKGGGGRSHLVLLFFIKGSLSCFFASDVFSPSVSPPWIASLLHQGSEPKVFYTKDPLERETLSSAGP